MQDMTDITEAASSYDLSEASSDNISTGSQDTDRHSNVTISTNNNNNSTRNNNISVRGGEAMHTSSNGVDFYHHQQQHQGDFFVQEEKDVYPSLLFSRGGGGGGGMSNPLPVVKEGRILRDELGQDQDFVLGGGGGGEYDVSVMNSCSEEEEQEFTREMNTTKIAFSAYRNAVLHLVHHQPSRKSTDGPGGGGGGGGGGEEKLQGDTVEQSDIDTDSEQDANLRMTILEDMAKRLVETKAKACFEAVDVANEFMERRMERTRGRNALFRELLNSKLEHRSSSIVKEKKKKVKDCVVVNRKDKVETSHATKNVKHRNEKEKKGSTIVEQPIQTFVPIRKFMRHPQCILDTLPAFRYQSSKKQHNQQKKHRNMGKDDHGDEYDDDASRKEETPTSYGTTLWIGDMIQWRRQRQIHKIHCLEKCGCPECSVQLKEMQSR